MFSLLSNTAIILYVFSIWFLSGLGASFLLLKPHQKAYAFLLAPLMGMILLTIVGLFEITILLVPFTPKLIFLLLVTVSLVCIFLNRKAFTDASNYFQKKLAIFLILPLLLLSSFAWLFHTNGFELLVGGTDQLQYSEDARHITEEMHTGSALDIPVPRQKYYVYEMSTRTLPYLKTYRRGAELLLGANSKLTGLSYENVFPITIIVCLLTLGLVLVLLGELFLELTPIGIFALQVVFLSSFYFLLLHIQGSLALMLSIPAWLLSLALLSRVPQDNSFRFLLLTGITIAGYISVYTEPGLLSLIFPTILVMFLGFFGSFSKGVSVLFRTTKIYLIVFFCATYSVYSVIENAFGHTQVVASNMHIFSSGYRFNLSAFQPWKIATPALGFMSYYDVTSFNNMLAQYTAAMPWLGAAFFIFLYLLAVAGFYKLRNALAFLCVAVMSVWVFAAVLVSLQQDYIRLMRSIEYAMPILMIGLVLLAFKKNTLVAKRSLGEKLSAFGGKIILTAFVFINAITSYHTFNFVSHHNNDDDPILVHYDESNTSWIKLKKEFELSAIHNLPVLISGFRETVRPSAIAVLLRSQPHFVGESMNFWGLYNHFIYPKGSSATFQGERIARFNTKIPLEKYLQSVNKENKPVEQLLAQFLIDSQQAIVPIGAGYPEEWAAYQDVFTPRIVNFKNIGDVVYKQQFDISLASASISPLEKDKRGIFRKLFASSPVEIEKTFDSPQQVTLIYDGKKEDVTLLGAELSSPQQITEKDDQTIIKLVLQKEAKNTLKIAVQKPVKLRQLSIESMKI